MSPSTCKLTPCDPPPPCAADPQMLLASCLVAALLCLLGGASPVPPCCHAGSCPCRLYDVLRGRGDHAAGILTLGRRRAAERHALGRLHRLLQGRRDHAVGILTVGKRAGAPSLPPPYCYCVPSGPVRVALRSRGGAAVDSSQNCAPVKIDSEHFINAQPWQ
ncbi:hypothetical protein GN956_G20722 [Arapaima gigas]